MPFDEFDDANSSGENVVIVDPTTPSQKAIVDSQGRLKTSTEITAGAVGPPADPSTHFVEFVRNGGSAEMNVDGSTTSVSFTLTVPANETWYIRGLGFNLADSNIANINNFGNIAGPLTNGLLIELSYNGTTHTITNLKTNTALLHNFHEVGADIFTATIFGFMPLDPSMTLETGDFVRATVRDNLTGLDQCRLSYHGWKVVS